MSDNTVGNANKLNLFAAISFYQQNHTY